MGSEFLQFGLVLLLFAIVLVGSYWFIFLPSRKKDGRRGNG
jgi:cbb3-type cytochrome oxidase subunit 3